MLYATSNTHTTLALVLFLVCNILISNIAFAAESNFGLVPCGTHDTPACRPCYLWVLASNILNFLFFSLAVPILTVVLIWGGFLMLTGGGIAVVEGKSSQISKGKKMIVSGVIGIFIVAGAWLIVNTIIDTLASGKFTAGWNNIECPATPAVIARPPAPPPGLTTGLTCNSSNQCVAGGDGKACSKIEDCTSIEEIVSDFLSCADDNEQVPTEASWGSETLNITTTGGPVTLTGASGDFAMWRSKLEEYINEMGSAAKNLKRTNILMVDTATFDDIMEESFPQTLAQARQEKKNELKKLGASQKVLDQVDQMPPHKLILGINSNSPLTLATIVCTNCNHGNVFGVGGVVETAFHELTHAVISKKFGNAYGDWAANIIYKNALAFGGFASSYAEIDAAEMLAEAATAYIVSNGTFRPKDAAPGSKAEISWKNQIDWLQSRGIVQKIY